jgi:hypothetical protein
MDCCVYDHHWTPTTSDLFRMCLYCRTIQKLINGEWQDVAHQGEVSSEEWHQSEYQMLNATYPPDYADHRKAATDLRNYWN